MLGVAAAAPAQTGPPKLLGLRISNGGTPFAGDTPWLATVSPNGDGFRDRALIRFKLDRPATVEIRAVATDEVRRPVQTVWSTRRRLAQGAHVIVWRPKRTTPDRTYLLRFVVVGTSGARRVYGFEPPRRRRLTTGLVVRVQGVEAGFLARSYPIGGEATVGITTDARRVRLQLFSFASVPNPTVRDLRTGGVAVSPAVRIDWQRRGNATRYVQISHAGVPRSGLYFLRVTASDGRVGYAPLILRPRTLGEHRVAVVLSTNTWQAYNFQDAGGDGWGDSWYVGGASPTVDLQRPYLDFGVPFRFRDWDLSFISWLDRTGKSVDFLSDDDLERVRTGTPSRRAYDLVVFPGHEEYVSEHVYDVVRRYRDLGGRPDVPLREQLLLEGEARGAVAAARRDVAEPRPAGGGARRRRSGRPATTARCRPPTSCRARRAARGPSPVRGFETAPRSAATGSRSTRGRRARRPARGCSRASRT